jgi:ribosome maturation factor RimP
LWTEAGLSAGKLTELLQPLVEELGYEFVGLEQKSQPKNPVIVVYIDTPDGISVEDCERVSREVAALLDVEDPISGNYNLEVSSPGLDRPLFQVEHYARFTGHEVSITLFAPQDGRRKFKGVILGVQDGQVRIDQDGVEVALDISGIARARLVPDYDSLF